MVDNVKIGVEVSDNGSASNTTKNVEKLHSVLLDAEAAANRTSKALGAANLSGSGKTKGGESVAYAQARGNIGTGAEARDFAKQSEGLGGLVRLYATYAANIYAAGAAFRALSEAANTANIIQGLNQLGAVSGVALGGLSKKFAEASGGAISLREAMQSTAQASSAGLSGKQFLQLGEVAKKASQALGINMSDAVSRLTRGITKLEPELLDELGIFTKIGPATENYAKSIGKSAASLTDFEKRQAFANAVLKEGIDKFNEIDIPTNPYDKLSASLSNLAYQTLSIVNTAIGPLINALSQSPGALLAVVTAIGTLMLKQALPALGQYRAGLAETAAESQKFYTKRSEAATAALDAARAASAAEIQAEKDKIAEIKTAEVDAAQERLKAVSKRGVSKEVRGILKKSDLFDITESDLAILDKLGSKNSRVASTYKELAAAIRSAQQANADFIASETALEARRQKAPGLGTAASIASIQAEEARKKASSKSIISQASETTAVEGLRVAFPKLLESLKTEKLGLVRTAFTGIAGSAAIVTTKVVGLISAFSSIFSYIGVLVTAYEMLKGILAKNTEEVTKYNDALKYQEENTAGIIATNKKYSDSLTIESILAKSTAFTNLADSVTASADALEKAQAKASWFDNLTNSISKIWSGDLESKFREGASTAIVEGLKGISNPEVRKEAEDSFKKLLNVKELTESAIAEAGKGIDPKAISSLFEKVKGQDTKATAPLQGLNDGFKNLNKSFQDLSNSLVNNDPISKFGVALVEQSSAIKEALKDPINAAGLLNSVLADTSKISSFPPETRKAILDAANNYKQVSLEIFKFNQQKEQANKLIEAANKLSGPGASSESIKQSITLKIEGEALLETAKIGRASCRERV